jgi:hypothetical protein
LSRDTRDLLLFVLCIALLIGVCAYALGSEIRRRRRRVELPRELGSRFGIASVRAMGPTVLVILDNPLFEGTLRANEFKTRSFFSVDLIATLRTPRKSWKLTSRRLWGSTSSHGNIELMNPELNKNFVVFAERPKDLAPLFDAEMEALLSGLDAGFFHTLRGPTAGIEVTVHGSDMHVRVTGQRGDDEEHLPRILRFIERIAQHGA